MIASGKDMRGRLTGKAAAADDNGFSFPKPKFHVWDSQYVPPSRAFSIFREAICSSFMPWTPEAIEPCFEGRVESIALESGVVGRVRMTPIVTRKTKADIARSKDVCIHGNLILSGELRVDQAGRRLIARPGDLVLHQSNVPTTLTVNPDCVFDNLALIIPMEIYAALPGAKEGLRSCVLHKGEMIAPLSACLNLLVANLYSAAPDELDAIMKACTALLPVAINPPEQDRLMIELPGSNYMLREILHFIESNIADPNLSPSSVAENFGVSARYVHKLLAQSGMTFSAHVKSERLKRIRWELDADIASQVPVSVAAHRWGFTDLSTFNRAFKRAFGCTPTKLRS